MKKRFSLILAILICFFVSACEYDADLAGEATYTAQQLFNMYVSQNCDQLNNTYSVHRARLEATIDVMEARQCSGYDMDNVVLGALPDTEKYYSTLDQFTSLLTTRFAMGRYDCDFLYGQYTQHLRRTNVTYEVIEYNDCELFTAQVSFCNNNGVCESDIGEGESCDDCVIQACETVAQAYLIPKGQTVVFDCTSSHEIVLNDVVPGSCALSIDGDMVSIAGGSSETVRELDIKVTDVSVDDGFCGFTVSCGVCELGIQEKFGVISQDETWSGKIHVTGDVLVEEGVTLTILPGTEVLVAANSDKNNLFGQMNCEGIEDYFMWEGINDQWDNKCGIHRGEPFMDEGHHISITIGGTLNAVGTSENKITIKSDAKIPGIYDWNFLTIKKGILSYATVENYKVLGTDNEEGSGDVEISHNILRNVGLCGVCANSDHTKVIYNEISYCGHELIDMHEASPTIQYNKLGPNPQHGGIVINGAGPLIEYNEFIGHSGIHFPDGEGVPSSGGIIRYNQFSEESAINFGCGETTIEQNNFQGYMTTEPGCAAGPVIATNNYWYTTDQESIEDRVNHKNDDPALREVIYQPFLQEPVDILIPACNNNGVCDPGEDASCADCAINVERPNIVVIYVDTLRADHLGAYRYPRDTSPNIDQLAAEGTLFENHISQGHTDMPAIPSFLTSLYIPNMHLQNGSIMIPDSFVTLPEAMKNNGYKTAGIVSGKPWWFDLNSGLQQGFDTFLVPDDPDGDVLQDEILSWIDQNSNSPFFLMVQYAFTHGPYDAPEPYKMMFVGDEYYDLYGDAPGICENPWNGYGCIPGMVAEDGILDIDYYIAKFDGELRYTDVMVGELIQKLKDEGIYENTIFVFAGDHGESLGAHNIFFDHQGLYDDTITPPLIIRYPERIPQNKRITNQVQAIDLYPTLLELISARIPVDIDGKSLMPLIDGTSERKCNAYSFTGHEGWKGTIRTDKWKYVYADAEGIEELYDLVNDPGETVNVLSGQVSTEQMSIVSQLKPKIQSCMQGDCPSDCEDIPIFICNNNGICEADLGEDAENCGDCGANHCSDGIYNEGEQGLDCGWTCLNKCVFAEKQGVLQQDETWSGNIYVNGHVQIPTGVTLTIKPGTIVKFKYSRDYKGFDRGSMHVNGGTIKAIGSSDKMIWFTSSAPDPINGDWGSIFIAGSDQSEFDYVIVEYGEMGIEQFDSSASVTNSIIRWVNAEGLYAERSQPFFKNNLLYNNGYHEIALEQYNTNVQILNNIFHNEGVGGGWITPWAIHHEKTESNIEGNYFYNYRMTPITAGMESSVRLVGNRFRQNSASPLWNFYGGTTSVVQSNDLGDNSVPVPNLDFEDIKNFELDYVPGDSNDRFPYIYAEEDNTRRVLKKLGQNLGFGWALEYVNGYLYKFTLGEVQLVRIDPNTGQYLILGNDGIMNPRGLTWDGEFFYVNDFSLLKIFKFNIINNRLKVVDSFDIPYKELGGVNGLTTDGSYLYLRSRDNSKVYKITKTGELVDEINIPGGPLVWTGKYFWVLNGCEKGICKYTKEGELVGEIYHVAKDPWAITWDGEHLWTIQRTCENWNDPKVYQIEILDSSLDICNNNSICDPGETPENCPSDCEAGCVCPMNYDPVCGEDSITYSNACMAGCADVNVTCNHECPCMIKGPLTLCPGCTYQGECVDSGFRIGQSKYCGPQGKFLAQKKTGKKCRNNFECRTGICSDGVCSTQRARKLWNPFTWFRKDTPTTSQPGYRGSFQVIRR